MVWKDPYLWAVLEGDSVGHPGTSRDATAHERQHDWRLFDLALALYNPQAGPLSAPTS